MNFLFRCFVSSFNLLYFLQIKVAYQNYFESWDNKESSKENCGGNL